MRFLLVALDVCCLVDKGGKLYLDGLGWFKRFENIEAEFDIACKCMSGEELEDKICISEYLNISKVYSVPAISMNKSMISGLKRIKDILKTAIDGVDGVIVRYQGTFIHYACKFAKKQKKLCLTEIGGVQWDAFWNYSLAGKILAPVLEFWCKRDIKHSNYVHYVTKEYLQRRYPTGGKSIGLTNAELIEFDDTVLEKRLDKIDIMPKRLIIGTAAAVNVKYKGQQYVIDALSVLKCEGNIEYEYQIVGQGDNSFLKEYALNKGVSDQVKFLGTLSHNEVFSWLDGLDVYIQPSLQEGLPRAMVEAMSRGLPCIGAKTAGIPELIDNNFIYVHRNMPVKIVELLLKINDNSVLKKQAQLNFNHSKEFNHEVIIKTRNMFYDEFIKECAKNRSKL